MPISSTVFTRITALLIGVLFLALLAIVGTSIWLGERTQVYFDEVVEAREAESATVQLRFFLQRAETSQRGFLLTRDPAYLEPYQGARDQVMPQFERFRAILAPYPQADEPVAHLHETLTAKLAEMDQTIALGQAGQFDEAVSIIRTDTGKQLMEEAQSLFTGVLRAADERLDAGVVEQRSSALALRWVSILGGVVILGGLGGAAFLVMRYTRELAAAREEVVALNSSLEERVRERTADLNKANEEIQKFAYIVTHDLRAPLVNIMGFTSELEGNVESLRAFMAKVPDNDDPALTEARRAADEELPEAIGFIRTSTRKMDNLINAILKISREGRRQLKPETVNLKALLDASASTIHHQVTENGGEVVIDLQAPILVSDRLSLEQIFGNLFDNAVKYRQPDRPIRIEVRGRAEGRDRIVVEIEDNGRGIAPQDHDRVFELFRRSGNQSVPGEGIGLSHVRTVVRNLGGEIRLRSELGSGTTFTISLPRDLRKVIGSTTQ